MGPGDPQGSLREVQGVPSKFKIGSSTDQLSGLVVRASALRLGGRGFDPRPSHTKDYKNGTQFLPAWRSASGVGLGCAVTMWLSAYHDSLAASRVRLPGPVTFAACLPPSLSPFPVSLLSYLNKGKSPKKYKSLKKRTRSLFSTG